MNRLVDSAELHVESQISKNTIEDQKYVIRFREDYRKEFLFIADQIISKAKKNALFGS